MPFSKTNHLAQLMSPRNLLAILAQWKYCYFRMANFLHFSQGHRAILLALWSKCIFIEQNAVLYAWLAYLVFSIHCIQQFQFVLEMLRQFSLLLIVIRNR